MLPVLIVFAKAPVPGRVKTRLAEALGAERAAALHRALVADTCARLRDLQAVADMELHTDEPTDAWAGVETVRIQAPGGLELKLLHALEEGLRAGRPRVTILGGDSPTLPADHLRQLLQSGADVALGPCEDGGYYAISCRKVDRRMFEAVTWSSPQALEQTVRGAEACGLSVEIGPLWYDVDAPADLERLLRDPGLGEEVRRALEGPGATPLR